MEDLLYLVRKPARYIGREVNAFCKSWNETRLKVCLVFPDLYELGMSHIGLQILYLILNQHEEILADRAYAPARDLENLLRRFNRPLISLEHKRPLREFDIVGISYPYELCATNIVNILDLSRIPTLAKDRDEKFPLILGGGSAAANPEPVSDFYDAIVIGEAEEAILEIAKTVISWKEAGGSRKELLNALAQIPGVYIPSFFNPRYEKGRFVALEPLVAGYEKIRRRIIPELDKVPYPWRPLVPWTEITHDRLALEISRGCTRGCRFCQASSLYRPVRERSIERLLQMAEEGLRSTGWDEVSFLSLSAGDYSCLTELLVSFNRRFGPGKIALSLPSLRVGSLNETIIQEIKKVRKTGFTLAPEAGTERLRRVINKDISEEDLIETAYQVFEAGWRQLKLYFMIGLPTETQEDLYGIVRLAKKLSRLKGRYRPQVTVSVSTFVPKPHTAFQWERQINLSETKNRLYWLKEKLRSRRIKFKWHLPEQSFLEGVFSRGDRRLSALILEAFRLGARLDGWSDEIRFELWLEAARRLGIDLDSYLRERSEEEPLPWDHISLGIKKEFLRAERARAFLLELTKDCRFVKCVKCGVCDFKDIKNRLVKPEKIPEIKSHFIKEEGSFWYRVVYQKVGWARFLSQLDLMRAFHRAVRRAMLPVSFSQGFHPLPRISFPRALPVGVESLYEVLGIELVKRLSAEELQQRLNQELPKELAVLSVSLSAPEKVLEIPDEVVYEVELKRPIPIEKVNNFLHKKNVILKVRRGEKIKEIEIRPYVIDLKVFGQKLQIILYEPSRGGVRATEVVSAIFGSSVEEDIIRILKLPPSKIAPPVFKT